MAFSARFGAVGILNIAIAGDQADYETGGGSAQSDSSRDGQKRKPDTAASAATEDEADAAGDRERSQRFFSDVFADVPLAATQLLIRIGDGPG